MVSEQDLRRGLSRLETLFNELEPEAMKEYIEAFRSKDLYVFNKAISLVIETHKTLYFPKVGEIIERYNETAKQIPTTRPEQDCRKCSNMGIWIDPVDELAKPCPECEIGKKIKWGWTEHDRKHGHFYTRARKDNQRGKKPEEEDYV